MRNEFHGRRKRREVFWGRTVSALMLVFVLLITTPFLSSAAGSINNQTGSLTVNYDSEKLTALVNDLYKVADVSVGDGGCCSYTPAAGFDGITFDSSFSSEKLQQLTQSVAAVILDPDTGKSKRAADQSGFGLGEEKSLSPGLYLLVTRGNSTEDYVTKTAAGDIVTKVSDGEDTYTFAPVLVSIPSWDSVSNKWKYDVEVSLKAERDEQNGSLKIIKTLQGSDAGVGPVTFVFNVEAELDGKKVYSNVVSMVFNGQGVEELLIENIPIGATVTVTEVYSGARCTLTSAGTQTATIVADAIASVAFTNEYDGRRNGGESITNHFRHEADGWKVDQLHNKSQG